MKFQHGYIWVSGETVRVTVAMESDDGRRTFEAKTDLPIKEAESVIAFFEKIGANDFIA